MSFSSVLESSLRALVKQQGLSKEYIIFHCSEETIWPDYSMVTDLLYEVILLN
jgi:hypothetical protein